jgi:hypothetical protein
MAIKRVVYALALGTVIGSAVNAPPALAAVTDEQVQQLLERIEAQDKRIAELEKASATAAPAPAVAAAPAAPSAASWTETISLEGDLRYRYENIDEEFKDGRDRSRIRARAGLTAKPQPDLEVGFGLSTSENGDPVSGNQTLGSDGSRKDVYIDLAYFNKGIIPRVNLTGGKFKNFLYRPGKNALLWDSDWNPEGLGLTYQGETFFASALGSWLDGDSSGGSTFMSGAQAGFTVPLGDAVKLTAGVGYYDIGVKGESIAYVVDDNVKYFGNSFVCDPLGSTVPSDCTYALDYSELEGFAELAFSLFDIPTSVFVDYVQNRDADINDTGYSAGFAVGKLKGKGTWDASYAYQDLEADAVLGILTDSDFGGGGTDTKGHVFRGAYGFGDKWNLGFSYFLNEIGENAGNERDYNRVQLDANFKY